MNSNRCGSCGFLNFAAAASCKRCKGELESQPQSQQEFFGVPPGGWQPSYETGAGNPEATYAPQYFPSPVAPLPRTSKNGSTNALLFLMLGLAIAVAVGIGVVWKVGKTEKLNLSWQEYKAADQSFSVEMPTTPQDSSETRSTPAGDLTMQMMIGNMKENGIYVVAYMDYPSSSVKASSDMVLDFAANGAVSNSGATMVSKKSISIDGIPGREVEMTVPDSKVPGGGRAIARIYWAAPRLYMMFVGGHESSEVFTTRAKFLDSFKLQKKF